jgi:hypothetical protein
MGLINNHPINFCEKLLLAFLPSGGGLCRHFYRAIFALHARSKLPALSDAFAIYFVHGNTMSLHAHPIPMRQINNLPGYRL